MLSADRHSFGGKRRMIQAQEEKKHPEEENIEDKVERYLRDKKFYPFDLFKSKDPADQISSDDLPGQDDKIVVKPYNKHEKPSEEEQQGYIQRRYIALDIIKFIARGAYGLVFSAVLRPDKKESVLIAIKVARTGKERALETEQRMLLRFHKDGTRPKSLVNLNAHLRNLYAGEIVIADVTEKVTLFCMEFLRGETLDLYCAKETKRPLPIESVFRITWDLFEAVEYLQKKGYGHNDILAQNVMILRLNVPYDESMSDVTSVKLYDFSIATETPNCEDLRNVGLLILGLMRGVSYPLWDSARLTLTKDDTLASCLNEKKDFPTSEEDKMRLREAVDRLKRKMEQGSVEENLDRDMFIETVFEMITHDKDTDDYIERIANTKRKLNDLKRSFMWTPSQTTGTVSGGYPTSGDREIPSSGDNPKGATGENAQTQHTEHSYETALRPNIDDHESMGEERWDTQAQDEDDEAEVDNGNQDGHYGVNA